MRLNCFSPPESCYRCGHSVPYLEPADLLNTLRFAPVCCSQTLLRSVPYSENRVNRESEEESQLGPELVVVGDHPLRSKRSGVGLGEELHLVAHNTCLRWGVVYS